MTLVEAGDGVVDLEDPEGPDGAGPLFREFVLAHEEEIVHLGNTRYTQTNESRRCVALLPLVMLAPFDRFHLVDIGTSAGLNLRLERYRYRFDDLEWIRPALPSGGGQLTAMIQRSNGVIDLQAKAIDLRSGEATITDCRNLSSSYA